MIRGQSSGQRQLFKVCLIKVVGGQNLSQHHPRSTQSGIIKDLVYLLVESIRLGLLWSFSKPFSV